MKLEEISSEFVELLVNFLMESLSCSGIVGGIAEF
jgi:hypothetical protein